MTSCITSCNLPCRQVYLEQIVQPTQAVPGATTNWSFRATNISGNNISGPIVISSSLFGTMLLTSSVFTSGQTLTLSRTYVVPAGSSTIPITSVAFVAQSSNGTTVGTTISKVVVTTLKCIWRADRRSIIGCNCGNN